MTEIKTVKVGNLEVANDKPFVVLAGPCAIESRQHALEMSVALKELSEGLGIGLVYKSSFDKANRTSSTSKRGVGLSEGLDILAEVKATTGLPIVTDVHLPDQCAAVAEVADILQIPAFLCRQADLLEAAGKTGRVVNVKKGQFLAPWDMANVANNLAATGNENIMLCDRGTSFGYNTLVTDFRGLPTMARQGYPVVFDATHSVQQPGGQGTSSGGQREFAPGSGPCGGFGWHRSTVYRNPRQPGDGHFRWPEPDPVEQTSRSSFGPDGAGQSGKSQSGSSGYVRRLNIQCRRSATGGILFCCNLHA